MITPLPLLSLLLAAGYQDPGASDLEKALAELRAQVQALQAEHGTDEARLCDLEARYQSLLEELEARKNGTSSPVSPSWMERLTIGGYGEIHGNFVDGPGGDQIDLTRFVLYFGYRFEEWIQLHSEVEIEHALVAPDGEGELSLEQLYVDFLIRDSWNVRVGRFLTPLGIINEKHEPPSFNGVERPAFETWVIPTTWSSDGIGIFGNLSERTKYQLYLGTSLDGSGFDAVDGIREGRQEEYAGVHEPAISGRLDWYPLKASSDLRLGLSFFGGGLNNGPQGVNPGVNADLEIYSTDLQYNVGPWDFRGAYAYEKINGAASIGNNVASAIDGYYVEAARHILPDAWRTGRWTKADLVAFVRYDKVDTQAEMPTGVTANPAGRRDVYTMGVSFFPTSNLVLKADYQIWNDDTPQGLPERFNVGLGWSF
jgi:hypothetical protein